MLSTENSCGSAALENHTLTRYPPGSLRELAAISLPLMLSLLSGSLMLFCDRLLLAQYSIEALTASATATLIASAIQFAFISTTTIAEVFVGQHNGAGKLDEIGIPVWQMIWFSLFSTIVFWPLAAWGGPYIFQDANKGLEIQCFFWVMLFGPIFCLVGSLTAFYIGLGKVGFVTFSVITANVVNVGLDLILIFGWEPHIPALGIVGAALATGIAQTVQLGMLFACFIHKENQKLYGTGKFSFHPKVLLHCLKVALPNSMTHTLEICSWAVLFQMMLWVSQEHVTVVAISQSIFFLFTFITDGVSKGSTAIAANLIGSNRSDLIWKLLWSGFRFYFLIFIALSYFLVFDPSSLIRWFLPEEEIHSSVKLCVASACIWIWFFFLFDGINWLIVGVLTAAGDTNFILKVGGSTPWVFAILPIYFLIVVQENSADIAWRMIAVYSILTFFIYLWRLRSGKWRNLSIVA